MSFIRRFCDKTLKNLVETRNAGGEKTMTKTVLLFQKVTNRGRSVPKITVDFHRCAQITGCIFVQYHRIFECMPEKVLQNGYKRAIIPTCTVIPSVRRCVLRFLRRTLCLPFCRPIPWAGKACNAGGAQVPTGQNAPGRVVLFHDGSSDSTGQCRQSVKCRSAFGPDRRAPHR